jgi:carbonic anhydrase/acetyltransferase-like protein (isoleucine patch superfamily)
VTEATQAYWRDVFVGWRAVIVGGVNIGPGAYVCAEALITKDVPAGYIAHGRNQMTHPGAWPGALGKSPFFRDPPRHPLMAALITSLSLPLALLRMAGLRTDRDEGES